MNDSIKAIPLKGLTDLPAFGMNPGELRTLQNMNPMPNGYVEARGGLDKLKISGGTATDPIASSGIFLGAHEHTTASGWVMTFAAASAVNSQYSNNRQFQSYFLYFATGAAGAGTAGDATYFGSDHRFSRLIINLSRFADWASATTTWEYWNGSWTALTMTENPDFEVTEATTGRIYASWAMPTDWVPTGVGDNGSGRVYKYWVRVRLNAISGLVTLPRNSHQQVRADWAGMREHYLVTGHPAGGTNNAILQRWGVNGTAAEWFSVNTALFSGNAARTRMASFRGVVYLVNGKDQKRWDGVNLRDIGLTPPSGTVTAVRANIGTGTLGAGVWNYALAYGHGPQQNNGSTGLPGTLYGFSAAVKATTYPLTTVALDDATIDWSALTVPSDVDEILIFRTQDMTNVDPEKRASMPLFLLMSIGRNADGSMATSQLDNGSSNFPTFPPVPLRAFTTDAIGQKPPEGAQFIAVHQSRLFLGFSTGDIYWSNAFEANIFDQVLQVIRLTKAHGGRLMGMIEFQDQIVAFTETQTWGITNVGLDIPQVYPIHTGVGCVAPDSIAEGDGLLFWAGHDGVYVWDGDSSHLPKKISGKRNGTFGKMTYENHGGSRATVHNRMYELRLMPISDLSPSTHHRWSFETGEWSTITHGGSLSLFPLSTWHAPLGHADAGVRHPVYGQAHLPQSDKSLYMGELTTQDSTNNYDCVADVHYTTAPGEYFTPMRALFYYDAPDGWATPVISNQNTTNLGSGTGTVTTGTPDLGADYSVIAGTFASVTRGSSDIVVRFSATTAASGTVNRQRLFGGVLQGNRQRIRRGGI